MKINVNKDDKLQIYSTYIKDVQNFTYQGSIVSTTSGTDEDIAARKRKESASLSNACLENPCTENEHYITKLRIFNTNGKSVLLCGSETRQKTTTSNSKI